MSKRNYNTVDIYQRITDQIIDQLENGTPAWRKPWVDGKGTVSFPHNAVTGRAYSGLNVLVLWSTPYACNAWLTYKQAKDNGGNVRKGEKGNTVVFWKFTQYTDKNGDESTVPFARAYTVFNVEQCDDLNTDKLYDAPESFELPDNGALGFAINAGAKVTHGGNRACYVPSHDLIQMPTHDTFKCDDHYSATMLHELTHWTSHKSRCDRQLGKRFGNDRYAMEELIAEIGSAFLCAQTGVDLTQLQHASYLDSWLRVLKADKRAIFTAASKAKAASEYVINASTTADETQVA